MSSYLSETSRLVASYESALNFGDLLGGLTSTSIAIEGSIKERMAKTLDRIKTFFTTLWNAISSFMKEHVVGETKVYEPGAEAIRKTTKDFMDAYNKGMQHLISLGVKNGEDALAEQIEIFKKDLDKVIADRTEATNNGLEKIRLIKKEVRKDYDSKVNAVPVKECKALIERTYTILKGTTNKAYDILANKAEADITDSEVALCNKIISVALSAINSYYDLALRTLKGSKINYKASMNE